MRLIERYDGTYPKECIETFCKEFNITKTDFDKQLRNFIYRAYAKIGLAIIEDNANHVKVISCKFKGEPFKTFRHFASTALLDAQAANPMLSDNFIKTQVGHKDIKTTRMIYGDHNDLDHQSNRDEAYIESLDNALKLN